MENKQIDRLIAEKVMWWKVADHKNIGVVEVIVEDGTTFNLDQLKPSENISDAWEVVDKLSVSDFELCKYHANYICAFGRFFKAYAKTAPLAICLAALKSVGMEG